jgi:hypothetical protein
VRVVLFSHDGNLLGAQRMLLDYLEATAGEDDRLLVSPVAGPLLDSVAKLPRHRTLVVPRPPYGEGKLKAVARRWRYVRRLAKLLREERADVVYVNTISHTAPLVAARMAGVPALVHVHEGRSYLEGDVERRARVRVLRRAPKLLLAVSQATADALVAKGIPAARIRVVHNGIPLPPPRQPGHRAEVGAADPRVPIFGMVGGVQPRKGIHHLVDAAVILQQRGVEARYVVVGGLGEEAYVRQVHEAVARAGLEKTFLLVGRQPEVDSWLDTFDVFVNPAVEEPFARVNLEAMAHALPVVAADVDGTREAVLDGQTGLLVPPRDPAALADALARLAADPALRAKLGATGRARVEERFTQGPYCQAIERAIRDVAGRS